MNNISEFLLYYLDIAGSVILIASLSPLFELMKELPSGHFRKWWGMLIALIFFFIIGYLYYVQQHHTDSGFSQNLIIPYILFFGSVFVFFTITLFLKTTIYIKRIYQLEIENITDPLMGISNRRHLTQILKEEFSKAKRYKHPFSILMIDIDHFKKVNDTYGHDVGDKILMNLGKLIQELIRETDHVARYGGEEIMVICPLTDAGHAVELAERLRQDIEARCMVSTDTNKEVSRVCITVSIGVAEYTDDIGNTDGLVKRADMALYRAKNEGRNCIFLCNGTTPESILLKKVL